MSLLDTLAELRRLNEPVPRPFRLPSREEVATAERALRRTFHPDYLVFLLTSSDVAFGTVEPFVVIPDGGHLDLVSRAVDAWAIGVPDDLLAICSENGDFYCMDDAGAVRFWSHNGLTDEAWPDLATWIRLVWIEGG
jgi:hypothetical protein